jgi:hypothetical protein
MVDRPDETPLDRVLDGGDASVRLLSIPSSLMDFREALGRAFAFVFR